MEDLPVPLSRVELYLAKACGMDVTVPEAPESRLEQYLAILAGDTSVEMPAPMSLTEQWLAYVLGVTPDPLLAVEGACYIDNQKVDVRYFAVAAGMPGAVLPPAPQNRKEQYWANIQGGGGGVLKYATGTTIALTDVVRGIEELQYVYGDTVQNGTPTPDAPVAVQTVTGEQSVEVHGKNLIDKTTMEWGWIRSTNGSIGGVTAVNGNDMVTDYIRVTGDTKYTASLANFTGSDKKIIFGFYAQDKSWISIDTQSYASNYSRTTTTPQNCAFVRIQFSKYDSWSDNDVTNANFMFETGSTATTYGPYQSATYTVNLGSTELCKIGNYQDYIYKSGDDWYVGSSDEEWIVTNSGQANFFYRYRFINYNTSSPLGVSNNFVFANIVNATTNPGFMLVNNNQVRFRTNFAELSIDEWRVWLSTHNTTVYYPLATPTDTQITDATLIGQLNAVNNATLPTPVATISVTADGTNLPGPLKISYYGEEE